MYTNQPGNSVGSPLRKKHEHRPHQQTNNLPLQGHWGKGTLPAQRTSFNTLDNWGHKTPTQSKRKGQERKVKGSRPETCIQYTRLHLQW